MLQATQDEAYLLAAHQLADASKGDTIGLRQDGSITYYSTISSPDDHNLNFYLNQYERSKTPGVFYMYLYYDKISSVAAFDLRDFGITLVSNTEGIPNPTAINISPNLSAGVYSIDGLDPQVARWISTSDMTGKVVLPIQQIYDNQSTVDLSNQNTGMYLMQIHDVRGKVLDTHKVVLIK